MSVETPDIEEPALLIVIVSPTFKLPLPVINLVLVPVTIFWLPVIATVPSR